MSWPANRRLAIALVASLALNLFLGGMMTASWLFREEPPPGFPRPGLFDRQAALSAIGEEHRPAIEAIWAKNGPELRRRVRALREARDAIRRQLTADSFDPAALAEAHALLEERGRAAHAAMQANIAEVAAALPDEERQRYFEATRRRPFKGPKGGFFGPPPEPPPE